MKKLWIVLATTALVVGSSTFTSCKKGENDPFLSLRSRKARLTGEWNLKSGITAESYTNSTGSGSFTITYTETEATITTHDGQSAVDAIDTYRWTFEKDGQYEFYRVTSQKSSNGVATVDPATYTSTTKGVWSFIGPNKDQEIKNREAVLLRTTSAELSGSDGTNGSVAYTGVSDGDVIMIDQLKNKEIIIKTEKTWADSDGNVGSRIEEFTFIQD